MPDLVNESGAGVDGLDAILWSQIGGAKAERADVHGWIDPLRIGEAVCAVKTSAQDVDERSGEIVIVDVHRRRHIRVDVYDEAWIRPHCEGRRSCRAEGIERLRKRF